MKDLPQLPEDIIQQLKLLRKRPYPPDFFALNKAIYEAGWPLRAVADPLNVSKTSVSHWIDAAPYKYPLPEVPEFPTVAPENRVSGAKKLELPAKTVQKLQKLAKSASQVRHYTDQAAQCRKDARELEELLFALSQAGYTRSQLSKACKVSKASINQRLRKIKNV